METIILLNSSRPNWINFRKNSKESLDTRLRTRCTMFKNRADQHQENVQTRQRSNQLYVQGPIDQQQYVHSQQQYPFNQRYKNLEQQQGDPSHLFQNIRMDGTNTPLHTLMHSLSPQVTCSKIYVWTVLILHSTHWCIQFPHKSLPRQEMTVRQFIPQQLSGFNNPPSVQPQDASEESCSQSSHTNSSCAAESSQIGSPEFLPALGMWYILTFTSDATWEIATYKVLKLCLFLFLDEDHIREWPKFMWNGAGWESYRATRFFAGPLNGTPPFYDIPY